MQQLTAPLVLLVVALGSAAAFSGDFLFEQLSAELDGHPDEQRIEPLGQPFADESRVTFLDSREQQAFEESSHRAKANADLGESRETATASDKVDADQSPDSATQKAPSKKGTEHLSKSSDEKHGPLAEDAEKAQASRLREQSSFLAKPDPPPSITCYHTLTQEQQQAAAQSEHLLEQSKKAGEQYKAQGTIKRQALQLSKDATAEAEQLHAQLVTHKRQFKSQEVHTRDTLRLARTESDSYKHFEKRVRSDVAQSKEAFIRYMKYKQLYIDSSANSLDANSVETRQYKELAEQHLKAYSQLKAQIDSARQTANGASIRYNQLSTEYHGMVNKANRISHQISQMAARYQHQLQTSHTEHARYHKFARLESESAKLQQSKSKDGLQERRKAEALQKHVSKSKRRYWELRSFIDKYSAQRAQARVVARTQATRSSKLQVKHSELRAEEQRQMAAATELKGKMETAQDAGKMFLANYKETECQPQHQKATAQQHNKLQVEAARENRKPENPSEEAAEPSDSAVLYKNLHSSFKQRFSDSLSKQKLHLGEDAHNQCKYYSRLVAMYSQLKDVHDRLSTVNQKADKQQLLQQRQKATLNQHRVQHYTREMNRNCQKARSRALLSQSAEDHAEACKRYKEVATANMEAAETTKAGLATQDKYIKMLRKELDTTAKELKQAATLRDGAKARIGRLTGMIESAEHEAKHPC